MLTHTHLQTRTGILVNTIKVKPNKILHLGASVFEEKNDYEILGIKNIYWIDASIISKCFYEKNIADKKTHIFIFGAVSDEVGYKDFYLYSNHKLSSLNKIDFHPLEETLSIKNTYKVVLLNINTIDIPHNEIDTIVIDIQSMEYAALKQIFDRNKFSQLKNIIVEASEKIYYENEETLSSIVEICTINGFELVENIQDRIKKGEYQRGDYLFQKI